MLGSGLTRREIPMPRSYYFAVLTVMVAPLAMAATPLQVHVEGVADQKPIPEKFALCQPNGEGKSKGGGNTRPTISWGHAPKGTRSFAVVVTDPDVPADFTDAGKEGKVVKHDAKRQLFYHWALANIPADATEIPGGPSHEAPEFGLPAKGSLEKYVDDPTQYGGPCPPWNDQRIHHYTFTVYALNVAMLDVPTEPTAAEVEAAAKKVSIAFASQTGTYTLNPALRP